MSKEENGVLMFINVLSRQYASLQTIHFDQLCVMMHIFCTMLLHKDEQCLDLLCNSPTIQRILWRQKGFSLIPMQLAVCIVAPRPPFIHGGSRCESHNLHLHNPIPTLVADGQFLQVSCGRSRSGRRCFDGPGHNGTSACPHGNNRRPYSGAHK